MSLRTFKSFESVAWIRFKIGADKCPLIKGINGLRGMQNENTSWFLVFCRHLGKRAGKKEKPNLRPNLFFSKEFLPRFKFEVVVHMLGEFGSCNANPGFNSCLRMCGETMHCCKAMVYMPFRVVIPVVCLVAGSQRHRFCANFRFAIWRRRRGGGGWANFETRSITFWNAVFRDLLPTESLCFNVSIWSWSLPRSRIWTICCL